MTYRQKTQYKIIIIELNYLNDGHDLKIYPINYFYF